MARRGSVVVGAAAGAGWWGRGGGVAAGQKDCVAAMAWAAKMESGAATAVEAGTQRHPWAGAGGVSPVPGHTVTRQRRTRVVVVGRSTAMKQ